MVQRPAAAAASARTRGLLAGVCLVWIIGGICATGKSPPPSPLPHPLDYAMLFYRPRDRDNDNFTVTCTVTLFNLQATWLFQRRLIYRMIKMIILIILINDCFAYARFWSF